MACTAFVPLQQCGATLSAPSRTGGARLGRGAKCGAVARRPRWGCAQSLSFSSTLRAQPLRICHRLPSYLCRSPSASAAPLLAETVTEDALDTREKCILVGVNLTSHKLSEARLFGLEDSLAELARLAETAGMRVVGTITQSLAAPVAGTYIGSGKVRETHAELNAQGACTVVFDVELSPAQQRTLEHAFGGEAAGIKVLDRTALILDIFAQRAQSREGILQVALALYQYRLPRLTRMWTHLERQSGAGGVGLRGPGETQLEVDRRQISAKMVRLRRELELVKAHRSRMRDARKAHAPLPVVALVGYTNAGKTTLLNALTGATALAEDRLFATLDPKTRRAIMPGVKLSPEMLVTDTVGFVQNLPTQLVAAFRATLEEVVRADCLVHVVDASAGPKLATAQMKAVFSVLEEIGAGGKPGVTVLNKVDCVEEGKIEEVMAAVEEVSEGDVVCVVAKTGEGVPDLGRLLDDVLRDVFVSVEAVIPYDRGDLVSAVYEQGSVDGEDFVKEGTRLLASVPRELAQRLAPFLAPDVDVSEGAVEIEDDNYWTQMARKRH